MKNKNITTATKYAANGNLSASTENFYDQGSFVLG